MDINNVKKYNPHVQNNTAIIKKITAIRIRIAVILFFRVKIFPIGFKIADTRPNRHYK